MIHFKRLCCRDCGSSFYDHVPLADETTKIARVTQLHILEDLKPFNSVFASVARKYDNNGNINFLKMGNLKFPNLGGLIFLFL